MTDKDFAASAADVWGRELQGVDATQFAVAIRIRRVALRLEERLERVCASNGFTVLGDYQVAAVLGRNDPMRPSEVALALRVTRAAVTGRLKRLELAGVVGWEPDPRDDRAKLVTLTEFGQDATRNAVSAVAAVYTEMFETVSPAQLNRLDSTLVTLLRQLSIAELPPEP